MARNSGRRAAHSTSGWCALASTAFVRVLAITDAICSSESSPSPSARNVVNVLAE
jgi:hypothetical protein